MPNYDPYGREANNDSLSMRVRAAMIGSQIPHLGAGDTHALAEQQYTEQERLQQAMGGAVGSTHAALAAAMGAGAVGPGGIDVNSYSGSIYGPAGSARPIAGYQRPSPETASQAADRILRGRFGAPPNQRGAVDISAAMGNRSVVAPYTATAEDVARAMAPTGMPYSAPNRSAALAAAMAPTGSSLSSGGMPDYGAPPTTVDGLLRDARAPIMIAMEGRRALAEDRAANIELGRSKEARQEADRAALFKAMQPQAVLPSNDAVGAAFSSGSPIPKAGSREPTFAEAMRGYLGAGGSPNAAAESAMKPLGAAPATIDFKVDPVTGARFAVGSKGNFAASGTEPGMPGRAPKAGAKPAGVEQIQIGGQPYIFHHETKRYFTPDGQEAFVKGPAPKAPDAMLKEEDPELYQVQRDAYIEHFKARGAAAPAEAGAGAGKSANAAAESAKPVAGTRATQNGQTFEYDGKAWKPVR